MGARCGCRFALIKRKVIVKTSFGKSALRFSTSLVAVALVATPAYAQDAAEDDENAESIVVTGSRIARPDLESVSPVTTVSAEQISLTGTVTLEELVNDLPQVIPGNNRTSNNAGGEDFATLDLRGLGPNRTLILVDGERLAPSSTTGAIDISQIPTGLIERIDVVTGGATAVYGSDAIAGVINFVLKDDYEGVELTGQAGIAEEGVGFDFAIGGLFGGNFDDGRGNLAVSMQYFDRDAVGQNRFDYSRTSGALGLVGGVLKVVDSLDDLNIAGGDSVIFAGGSATNPAGTVVNNAGNPFTGLATLFPTQFGSVDTDCNPATAGVAVNGGSLSFSAPGVLRSNTTAGFCQIPIGNSSRYNFAPQNFLLVPFDRFNVATIGTYEFSDRTSAKLFVSFSQTNAVVNLAPTPAAGGTGFVIAADAPTLPLQLRQALATRANPTAPFSFNRRFAETGPRVGNIESNQLQARLLLRHELSDNFNIDGTISYGRTDFDNYDQGNINRVAVEQGVNGCRNSAGVVRGPGVLPGCVNVDIFGPDSITGPALAFIRTDTQDTAQFEQVRAAVNLTGSLFELPGGPVGIAVGAEYRKDSGRSTPDDAKVRGEIIGFNASQPLGGTIIAKEAYGEVRIPIIEQLALEAGARYSDYSSAGGLFNYKLAAEFKPFEWVKFRGAYNRAARAPSVIELFQAGDQGFPTYNDPCNQTNAARDTAFCQAQFTANGASAALVTGFAQNNQQVQAFAFGNPDLSEEKAETYTLGVVLQPRGFPLGQFSATVDYYNISLGNRIATQGAAFFIGQCYNQQIAAACARITRSSQDGQITQVNTTLINDGTNDLKTSGIDASLNWRIGVDEIFGKGDGRITIANLFTWVDKFTIGGTEFVDIASDGIGSITSEFANTLSVAYQEDKFTGQVRWVYKSGGDQSGGLFGPDEDTGFITPRVPDLNVVDLSLRYAVTDNFDITGIVENLFNEFPPQTAIGTFEQANTNVSFYSDLILGRTFTVSARLRF